MTYNPLLKKSQWIIIWLWYNSRKVLPMDIRILVGKRVKELRNRLGVSQEELAEIAELDRTYITSVERGKRNISIVNIEKIATALNISLRDFFNF